MLKVLAWNIGRPSPAGARRQAEIVAAVGADVGFFTEWSPLPSRISSGGKTFSNGCSALGPALADLGYVDQRQEHVSDRLHDGQDWYRGYWGVLGAAASPIEKVEVTPHLKGAGQWLEVFHPQAALTLVGVRQLAWDGNETSNRRVHWEWMLEQFARLSETPAVVMGDFNTEHAPSSPAERRRMGSDLMDQVISDLGWTLASARHPVVGLQPTYWHRGRSRALDHVFVSPAAADRLRGTEVVTDLGDVRVSGPSRGEFGEKLSRISDHAPIVVTLGEPSAARPTD